MNTPNRRDFVAHIAGAAGLAAAGCAHPGAASTSAPHALPMADWERHVVQATHRAVFDSPAVESGTALNHAYIYMDGVRQTFGTSDADIAAVVVVRHAAMTMVLGSALWQRYELGKTTNDPFTHQPATRNPYETMSPEMTQQNEGIESGITNLQRRGVTLLACSLALTSVAKQIAKRLNRDVDAVNTEIRAGLIPGVVVMPSGIFAVARAQELGCVLVKST